MSKKNVERMGRKKLFMSLLIFLATLIGLAFIRFWLLPSPVQEILLSKYFTQPIYSHTMYSGPPVDTTEIHKAKIYKAFFELERSLDADQTRAFVTILLDATNYAADPPESDVTVPELTFTYFDKEGSLLGWSYLNPQGEMVAIPYNLIGGTGYLTSDGLRKLRNMIELE